LLDLPGIAPLLKSSIIKFSANIKPLLKDATKAWRGLEFELVRHHKAILHKEICSNNYFIQERKILLAQDAKFICQLKQAVLFRFVYRIKDAGTQPAPVNTLRGQAVDSQIRSNRRVMFDDPG